jgi:hypothetical protein
MEMEIQAHGALSGMHLFFVSSSARGRVGCIDGDGRGQG